MGELAEVYVKIHKHIFLNTRIRHTKAGNGDILSNDGVVDLFRFLLQPRKERVFIVLEGLA